MSLPEAAKASLTENIATFLHETLRTAEGRLPLLEPTSMVAGKLSVLKGAYYVLSQAGGRAVLLGGAAEAPPVKLVIIGAGIALKAERSDAVRMGTHMTVVDFSAEKLGAISIQFGKAVYTANSTPETLKKVGRGADLLTGEILIPGAATPRIITRERIRSMRSRSVFVDISIYQKKGPRGGTRQISTILCMRSLALSTTGSAICPRKHLLHQRPRSHQLLRPTSTH